MVGEVYAKKFVADGELTAIIEGVLRELDIMVLGFNLLSDNVQAMGRGDSAGSDSVNEFGVEGVRIAIATMPIAAIAE